LPLLPPKREQEDSPPKSSSTIKAIPPTIKQPFQCRTTKNVARLVSCAVFFAAFAVASAVFFTLLPAFSVFAYCFLMRCFCQNRETGFECARAGLSCNAF